MQPPKSSCPYQARLRGINPEDHLSLRQMSCCLPISVGQSYHEGIKFKATLELIEYNFSKCTLIIADLLQRHNYLLNPAYDEKQALQIAKINGENWLKRNRELLDKVSIPIEILPWEKLLYHPNFSNFLNIVKDAYKNNDEYRSHINKSIENYIRRKKNRTEKPASRCTLEKNCLNYLLEECAAVLLWNDMGYHFDYEIYPSKRSSALESNFTHFIAPKHPTLLKPAHIKFVNISQKAATAPVEA